MTQCDIGTYLNEPCWNDYDVAFWRLGRDEMRKKRGKSAKSQGHKTLRPNNAPTTRSQRAAATAKATDDARFRRERDEALEQLAATSEVLKVVSSSSGELEPVFNAMLENATRICHAEFGTLYLRETDSFRAVAIHNAPPAYVQARKGKQVRPPPDSALGQVASTYRVAQIEDITKIRSYVEGNPFAVSAAKLGGYRTLAAVPMLKNDELVGAILIYRQKVHPFGEKQIALLQNFAAQAVIAIENTRLLNELRQRTDDLSDALEQQIATSEVLKVISSSPGELKPVFETMLAYAVRICEAKFGTLFLCEGDDFRVVAEHNTPPALVELHQREQIIRVGPSTSLYRSKKAKQPIQVPDLTAEPARLSPARSGRE